jgi:hypothetical protein
MKAIFAYNFRSKKMDINPEVEKPKFGGPNSAFTPYKVCEKPQFPEIRHRRKSAFRKLKLMFGMTEPVGIGIDTNKSSDLTSASQK